MASAPPHPFIFSVLLLLILLVFGCHHFALAVDVRSNARSTSLVSNNSSSTNIVPVSRSFHPPANCNSTILDLCLGTIVSLLDNPTLAKGIPDNQEAVLARCKMFKTGMTCIDDYKERCLTPPLKQAIEQSVAGARHTFAFLCDDPVFQTEFLQHQSCFKGTSSDWEHCANHFELMVAEELALVNISRAERNLGLCCAKHGFLRCVYYSAQFKCRKDAALFLMKVAQTLTDVQVHEDACRKIKFDTACTGDGGVAVGSRIAFASPILWITWSLVVIARTLCWT